MAGSGGGDGGKWRGVAGASGERGGGLAGAKVYDSHTLAGETRTGGGGLLYEFSGLVRPITYL